MRSLKILVVLMGIMLVGGVAVLAATIAGRLSRGGAAAQAFTAAPVEIPADARIEAMTAGADRIVLDLALPDGARQLLIFDLATGRKLGTIPLEPRK